MSLLAESFRNKMKETKNHDMIKEAQLSVAYSTGFLGFDFSNGVIVHAKNEKQEPIKYYSVGVVDGSIIMVVGRSASGKTTWAIQAGANIVRPFKNSAIFHDDAEANGVSIPRILKLTGFTQKEYEDRYILRNAGITSDNFYERIRIIHQEKTSNPEEYQYDTGLYDTEGNKITQFVPTVYILDSVALLIPKNLSEEEKLSGSMSTTATVKTNTSVYRRIVSLAKSANIIFFMINHITDSISTGTPTKSQIGKLKQNKAIPGGKTITYVSSNIIEFNDAPPLKETEGLYVHGSVVDVNFIKSRSSNQTKPVPLLLDYDNGFDEELSLYLLLKQHGRVNGAGAYLYLGEHKEIKFAQKNLKEYLRTKEDFRNIFMEEVQSLLTEIIERGDRQIKEQEEENKINKSSGISNNILGNIMGTVPQKQTKKENSKETKSKK